MMMYTSWFVIGISIFVSASVVNLQDSFIKKEVYEDSKRRDENASGKIIRSNDMCFIQNFRVKILIIDMFDELLRNKIFQVM